MPLPPDLYDKQYFLSECCEGWDDFQRGRGLSRLKQRELALLGAGPGVRVLDAGCGRGEVLLACHQRGGEVSGVDYSEAAVAIAKETLADVEGADVRQGDVTDLPWPDASFDRILFGDVIEHLDPDQADAALAELRRVLAPGGTLVVHTAPNLLFLRYAWPFARLGLKAIGRGAAAHSLDDWIAASKQFHVNEQSVHMLRAGLARAGFGDVRAFIGSDVARGGAHHLTRDLGPAAAAAKLAGLRPLRLFLGNDLYAIGVAAA